MQHIKEISLSDIEDINFWKSIAPSLSITNTPFKNCNASEYVCDDALADKLKLQVIEDGYFKTPLVLNLSEIEVLRNAVLNLHSHNIMPVFASLYDEYWQLLYKLRNYFSSFLLDNYTLVPDFWIWHVAANDKVSGWGPHRDGGMEFSSIRNDGTPTLCTVWIPLSNVTTENSCIYVLPRKHDAIFQDFVRRKFGQPGIPDAREMPIPLQHLRALPVEAGAMLGWDTNIFHWGSASSKWAAEPRISIGVYYQSVDSTSNVSTTYDNDQRRFVECKLKTGLTFENRLTIIANILKTYIHKFDIEDEREEHFTDVIRAFQNKWKRC